WGATVDHKRLGIMYIAYALVFLAGGPTEATLMRLLLIGPHSTFLSPPASNRPFTLPRPALIFFAPMPIPFGFADSLLPLITAARDMAFPRLTAFSFWVTAFGGVFWYASLIGASGLYGAGTAPDVGWFAYAPLTSTTFSRGHSTDYWTLAVLVSGIG